MTVSSAYSRAESPSSTKCGTTPWICPASLAHEIRRASISTTILNRIGDNGSPAALLSWFEKMSYIIIDLYCNTPSRHDF
jgi:hypothetical protein